MLNSEITVPDNPSVRTSFGNCGSEQTHDDPTAFIRSFNRNVKENFGGDLFEITERVERRVD
jgi:hypothetical protein